ncbi:hypothetical protein N7457_002258 [Penicillium paradoxum]|uniref:uncharacterized protein n=1 Tax=Penicillium paradoxum TaxID=176176 RepID=UPI0025495868|nr:uncharacterized protein N7457_002258 [Penicillium paradoxum]KAJ5787268.1 hypothetical protein N7457_002258 [Penicillium paradoxum]
MSLRLGRILRTKAPASPHARQPLLRVPPSQLLFSSLASIAIRAPASTAPPSRQKLPYQTLQTRNMSSAPAKREFLCILPDKPGAQAKRLEVRPLHLEGAKVLGASGSLALGGAMLNSHPAEGETPSFKGSVMLVVGDSEAEVRDILNKDIYTTSGVWDMENAQIIPFKSALREALL